MKNSLRIHKWTHNEFNIFILGVLTRPLTYEIYPEFYFFAFSGSAITLPHVFNNSVNLPAINGPRIYLLLGGLFIVGRWKTYGI